MKFDTFAERFGIKYTILVEGIDEVLVKILGMNYFIEGLDDDLTEKEITEYLNYEVSSFKNEIKIYDAIEKFNILNPHLTINVPRILGSGKMILSSNGNFLFGGYYLAMENLGEIKPTTSDQF
ncbi:hypothetical protein DASC09_060690 [Saccharomycopsis crataegensis]|uniref:Uncharacterized protein n=1 Tax=Saccharomycopsis crataegensis TaxID=43959 RepID=A0AAV5QVK7_9ASCO|nr:hypothetical protein DASC09_060630 [Saccharomycopsis crataegensis]GMM38730.1 hypothetical protein DASC09_060690 [Saccharomycopsis crataegensis]